MCGESGTSRTGVVHHYYKCVSVKKKRAECHKKPVKKRWIEDLVVEETMKMVMDDDVVDAIVSMLMDLQGRESTNLPLYQQQLKETETKIENLLKAITEGVFTKSTKTLLEELEAAKEELENRISLEKLEKPQISEEFMRFWLHRFRKLDMAKKEHRQMLIDVFINSIFLYDDKMLITFNYKEGTKTITFDDVKKEVSEEASGSDLDCSSAPEYRHCHKAMPVFFGLEEAGLEGLVVNDCRWQSEPATAPAAAGQVPPPAPADRVGSQTSGGGSEEIALSHDGGVELSLHKCIAIRRCLYFMIQRKRTSSDWLFNAVFSPLHFYLSHGIIYPYCCQIPRQEEIYEE